MSIKVKVLIPMIIIVFVTVSAMLVTQIVSFAGYASETSEQEVEELSSFIKAHYDDLWAQAKISSAYVAADNTIRQCLESGDRQALLTRANTLTSMAATDFCTFLDIEGNVILRTHEPDNYGDSLASQKNISEALQGNSFATLETGSAVKLSVRSGSPIFDEQGKLIGAVSMGFRLDTFDFVDNMKQMSKGADITIYLGEESLSTTFMDKSGSRATVKPDADISSLVLGGSTYSGVREILEQKAMVKFMPISSTEGKILGMLSVTKFLSSVESATRSSMLIGGGIGVAVLLVAAAVILVITTRIVRPIGVIVEAADKLSEGDVNVTIDINTKDETRRLSEAFRQIITHTQEQAALIEQIAAGDFTMDVVVRSDKDVIGKALLYMIENNSSVFRNIIATAESVSEESRQIADGAQLLAQGSTEQAGVVRELSSAASQVSTHARENAGLAEKAESLAETIKKNASLGSSQMNNLTRAVEDINESSQSISRVINVIDDIAFQTNILALNAAVEAARAGQHGKGFAVVAEEVRALAGKSAEAAKNTSQLISDSIEKAGQGARIAQDTAKSLASIVEGIGESNQIISDIAAKSEAQSSEIEQINTGINQLSQVTQQNSATAEQSAAASHEMSEQSAELQRLVSGFRLRGDDFFPEENASRFGRDKY